MPLDSYFNKLLRSEPLPQDPAGAKRNPILPPRTPQPGILAAGVSRLACRAFQESAKRLNKTRPQAPTVSLLTSAAVICVLCGKVLGNYDRNLWISVVLLHPKRFKSSWARWSGRLDGARGAKHRYGAAKVVKPGFLCQFSQDLWISATAGVAILSRHSR